MWERKQLLGLREDLAGLRWREAEPPERTPVREQHVDRNYPPSDKQALFGSGKPSERGDRIHARIAHPHEEVVFERVVPAEELDAGALGIRDGLGRELGIGDQESTVERAGTCLRVAGEDVV